MSSLRLLYRGEAPVDFPRLWRRALVASATLLVIGIGSFALRGLNLGLDFEGGTSYEVRSPGTSVADAREVMADLGAARRSDPTGRPGRAANPVRHRRSGPIGRDP